jgi:hypothetical protein
MPPEKPEIVILPQEREKHQGRLKVKLLVDFWIFAQSVSAPLG